MGKSKRRKGETGSKPPENVARKPEARGKQLSLKQLALLFLLLGLINYSGITLWHWAYTSNKTVYQVTGQVGTKVLPSQGTKFARGCETNGVPVVLRNSLVEFWKARNWTPSYLESKLQFVSGVYENDNRWFGPYYDSRKPLTDFSTRTNPYRTDVKMSGKEFFRSIEHPVEGRYLYFTGDIDTQLGEWALREIQPIKELLILNPKRSSINVWIGQPHVVAHCHYDGYHNFYAQLYGTKKFTLFKPTNWPGLYPYPFLHPSHAQAQVNLSNVADVATYPLVEKAEAVEITLQPGDLLYMPPLWFHHVESLEVSISVNVWTDSQQTELMEEVFALRLPVNAIEWTNTHTKAIATSLLIHSMLEGVCQWKHCLTPQRDAFLNREDLKTPDKSQYFVYRLWTTRYRTLIDSGTLPGQLGNSILCESGQSMSDYQVLIEGALSALDEADLQGYVDKVGEIVERLPDETWELWIGNYVEFVAANAVSAEHVGLLLKHFGSCLKLV